MTTRSTWPLSLACLAAAAGVAAYVFLGLSSAAEREAVFAARTRLVTERQRAEARLAAAERERSQLQAELTTRAKQNASAPGNFPGAPMRPPPDPAQLASQARQAEARLALKYAPFYRAAGIDAATAARFESVWREQEAQERDLWEIAGALPPEGRTEVVPSPDGDATQNQMIDPAIAAIRRRLEAQFQADQIAVLGEAGFRRLQEYQQNEGRRKIVERFVGDMTLTDSPASPEQTRQLTAILAASDLTGKLTTDETRWPGILARARGVLDARQLEALKKQAVEVERAAALDAFSRLLREQEAGRAPP